MVSVQLITSVTLTVRVQQIISFAQEGEGSANHQAYMQTVRFN